MQVVLSNKPEEKRKLLAALEQFAQSNKLPPAVVPAADLSLEEHVTNVMNYGYNDALAHEIIVRFAVENQEFVVEVEDDGKPFNPLEKATVDTSVPLEEKPIGGLGIHLMRQFMDTLRYRRENDRNILHLRKRLK